MSRASLVLWETPVIGDVSLHALKLGEASIRTTFVGIETQNCTLMCVGFGMYTTCVYIYVYVCMCMYVCICMYM
jgi:hypothetical protein